jgi:hypothetical protein
MAKPYCRGCRRSSSSSLIVRSLDALSLALGNLGPVFLTRAATSTLLGVLLGLVVGVCHLELLVCLLFWRLVSTFFALDLALLAERRIFGVRAERRRGGLVSPATVGVSVAAAVSDVEAALSVDSETGSCTPKGSGKYGYLPYPWVHTN